MEVSSAQAAESAPNAFTRGTVYRLRGWQWLAFWPPALGLDLYYKTLRFRMETEVEQLLRRVSGPLIIMAWHNHSLAFPALWKHIAGPPVTCLISASKMAAWEAAYFEHRGLLSIRGSSTRRSIQATREMVRTVREGGILGIAPDGPSGPLHEVKRGAVMIARQCNVPILLLGMSSPQSTRLKTWDRHFVPWPFAKIDVRARIIAPLKDLGNLSNEEAADFLREATLEISEG